ncbi:uncharacterized protein RJT20DRAFT_127182 [Scheffersomyces xylosifermentans]|uniref:uncharacterized protein n=1 Tax=Scheffersomyces xylosifermentans TaxID=1304137 RepID=UPI00315D3031
MSNSAPLSRLSMLHSHLKDNDERDMTLEFPMLPKHERKAYDGKFHLLACRLVKNALETPLPKERLNQQRPVSLSIASENRLHKVLASSPNTFIPFSIDSPQSSTTAYASVITSIHKIINKKEDDGEALISSESGLDVIISNVLVEADEGKLLYISIDENDIDPVKEMFDSNRITWVSSSDIDLIESEIKSSVYRLIIIKELGDSPQGLYESIKNIDSNIKICIDAGELNKSSNLQFDKWKADFLFASCGPLNVIVLSKNLLEEIGATENFKVDKYEEENDSSIWFKQLDEIQQLLA